MASHLRLGSDAPDFEADTTAGRIRFHDHVKGSWAILFSHPQDYTPVCTTELGAFAKLEPEFTRRGVKLLGLSADELHDHEGWVRDIAEVTGGTVKFPIIADPDRKVAALYDMIDYQDPANVDRKKMPFTIRSVFFIDPKLKIRTILSYPASAGRNASEVLRIVDSLQTTDRHRVATPIDWQPGQDVIVAYDLPDDEAKKLFPSYRTIKPYLRYTSLPKA
ncbi:Mitochondrial peroxiredoxin PRX1 [Hirsutella minnesotensis 3608]|uniref:Mitochondrial peroxiredoxin PRX1 n=1 Tax=Hirsutella minnesotensis 3608 TaxID=1043627 RepID=A0A0F7ZUR0_9HYPO|nr:Mitochondrial peroxiredoxin PRX1 [Hirsutella minnesotensis 3608]